MVYALLTDGQDILDRRVFETPEDLHVAQEISGENSDGNLKWEEEGSTTLELLNNHSMASLEWGSERDYGYGQSADKAEALFEETHEELKTRILLLESTVNNLLKREGK